MFNFYRKDSNYADVFDLFFKIIDDLGQRGRELEINKLDFFSTPSSKDKIIPLLHELYNDHYAVSESISKILGIKNFSDYNISSFENIIIDDLYFIYDKVIFFKNPLSEESQNVIRSLSDYEESEILFNDYGIIQNEQLLELKNKIDKDLKSKRFDLDDLSVSKIFQDILKKAIKNKSTKIKIFIEDNLVKTQLMIYDNFIEKTEIVISNINNFDTINNIIKEKFTDDVLIWKYYSSFFKITYSVDEAKNIYLGLFELSSTLKTLDDFNLTYKDLNILKQSLNSPSGVIIISGNANSGKRTSFYSCLNYIKSHRKGLNIITQENFIKNTLSNIVQIESNDLNGIDNVQDNYNIFGIVGTSDDYINKAFEMASNGSLVLLVIDSSSIFNTINKIYNSISNKTLITENLLSIMNTALLKTVCSSCSSELQFGKHKDAHLFVSLENIPALNDFIKVENEDGCKDCFNGYNGRVQLLEVIENDEILKELFLTKYNLKNFKIEKRSKAWRTLFESSIELLKVNETSLNSIIQSIGYYKK